MTGIVLLFGALAVLGLAAPKYFRSTVVLFVLAVVPMFALLLGFWSSTLNPITDAGDGSYAKIAWLWLHGWPIHPAPGATESYALLYGPLGFMLVSFGFLVNGPSLISALIAPTLACAAAVILVYLTCRKLVSRQMAFTLTGLFCGLLFMSPFPAASHWIHSDPFLILFSAAACFAATSSHRSSLLLVSALAGLSAAAKPHGVLTILPLIVCLADFRSVRSWLTIAFGFLIPIALVYSLPGTSLLHQWLLTRAMTAHFFSWNLAGYNVVALFVMLFPLIAVLAPESARSLILKTPRRRAVLFTAMGGALLTLIPASKAGSSAHHFLPFLPGIITATAWVLRQSVRDREVSPLLFITCCGAALLAAHQSVAFYRASQAEQWAVGAVRKEANAFQAIHPGKRYACGIGENWQTHARLVPIETENVLRQNLIVADMISLIDMAAARRPLSESTQTQLLDRYDVWILPAGEKPFAFTSFYLGGRPLFSSKFVAAFEERFTPVRGRKVDFWVKKN